MGSSLNLPDVTRVAGGNGRLGDRQCTATRADGNRCEQPPIRGGAVCATHGGSSPNAKRAAAARLLAAVEPAIGTLLTALSTDCAPHDANNLWCKTHGQHCPDWPVRVNAAKALMDRAGFGPQAKITVEKQEEDLSEMDRLQLASELNDLSRLLLMKRAQSTSSEANANSLSMDEEPDSHVH